MFIGLFSEAADASEALLALHHQLRAVHGVRTVERGCDLRRYAAGPCFEMWVSVVLCSGITIDWWIDVEHGGGGLSVTATQFSNASGNSEPLGVFVKADVLSEDGACQAVRESVRRIEDSILAWIRIANTDAGQWCSRFAQTGDLS